MSQQQPGNLRKEIKEKQNDVSDYLSHLERLGNGLTYLNIISGAAAVLLNGELIRALSQDTISSTSWLIPFGAALFSLAATAAASVHKVQVESRLSQLQRFAAKMEGLATLLDAGQITEDAASKRYQKGLEECPLLPRRREYPFDAVRGTIAQPKEGQVVTDNFDATGTALNLGRDIYLWLAIEIDDRIWPKEGRLVVDSDGEWRQPVFEDGIAEQFALSLWAANDDANRKLRMWLDTGNRIRVFPELRPLPGMRRLARVRGLRHEKSVLENK